METSVTTCDVIRWRTADNCNASWNAAVHAWGYVLWSGWRIFECIKWTAAYGKYFTSCGLFSRDFQAATHGYSFVWLFGFMHLGFLLECLHSLRVCAIANQFCAVAFSTPLPYVTWFYRKTNMSSYAGNRFQLFISHHQTKMWGTTITRNHTNILLPRKNQYQW